MEPRPQKPRQPVQPQGPQQTNQQPTQYIGPDPSQLRQQPGQPGLDPAAFQAPPRAEYDYSPLDLQPPGQRRKRQVIAGIIGALAVVAITALIVAGWMALRGDEDDEVGQPTPPDRVAELNSTPTSAPEENVPPGEATQTADQPPAPTAPPEPTQPAATVYDETSIRGVLPPVTSLPEGFVEAGDTPTDLATTTTQLTCETDPGPLLDELGWQAAMSRRFDSSSPETTGTTTITVSAHAFKDEASAQRAVEEYAAILECFQWTRVDGEPLGPASQYLTWSNPDTGESSITIYFTDGQVLYRVFASGPADFDSIPNAVQVARRILGQ